MKIDLEKMFDIPKPLPPDAFCSNDLQELGLSREQARRQIKERVANKHAVK